MEPSQKMVSKKNLVSIGFFRFFSDKKTYPQKKTNWFQKKNYVWEYKNKKTPGLITPPLFKKKFSDLKNGLITPPFGTENVQKKISHLIRICDGEVGVISSSYILDMISAITWFPFHRFIYMT